MRTLVIFTSGSTEAKKKKEIRPDLRLLCTCRFSDILLQLSGGGGGGGTQQIFIRGGSASRSNPLPF